MIRLFRRIFALCTKEFRVYRRDPNILRGLMLVPLAQLTIFGFVIQTQPLNTPISVVNLDHSPYSRTLISQISQSKAFSLYQANASQEEAYQSLVRGDVTAVLTIPAKWSLSIAHGHPKPLSYEIDGSFAIAAQQTVVTLNQHLDNTLKHHHPKPSALTIEAKPYLSNRMINNYTLYNPEQLTRISIIPPMIGVVLTMGMVQIMAMSLVSERERGTLDIQLQTPTNLTEIVVSKMVVNMLIGLLQLCFILFFMVFVLSIPIHGSLISLFAVTLPFLLTNLIIGLLFAIGAKSQFSAVLSSMVIVLPSFMLTGVIFPIYSMPSWAQWISAILPNTYYAKMSKAVILKGAGLPELLPILAPLALLMLFYTALCALQVKLYKE
ncbi:MAG: ABC transporter permease [Pseudomonadota bacterium]|nr:ABC transporter permease [Pseudomonadota bacterium]